MVAIVEQERLPRTGSQQADGQQDLLSKLVLLVGAHASGPLRLLGCRLHALGKYTPY